MPVETMVDGGDQELEELLDELPEELAKQLRRVIARRRQLVIGALRAAAGRGARLRLGQVHTGRWRARDLRAEKLALRLKAEGLSLDNSRLELQLDVEVGFSFPRPWSSEPRVVKVGPAPGRVSMPTLPRIDLSFLARGLGLGFVLSSISGGEATADVAPRTDVDAGSGGFAGARGEGLCLSASEVAGPGLEGMHLPRVSTAEGRAARVVIDRLGAAGEVRVDGVELRRASVPEAKVGAVEGGELDLDFSLRLPNMKIKSFPQLPDPLERLVTRFWLEVQPTVLVHIGNLSLDGLGLSAEVGAVRIGELRFPFELRQIEVDEVDLEALELDDLRLEADDPEEVTP